MNLVQNGSDNDAVLTQEDDGKSISLTQNGDANKAVISLSGPGAGNSAVSVTQNGGAQLYIRRGG